MSAFTTLARGRCFGALAAACALGSLAVFGAASAHGDPVAPADVEAQCESPEVSGIYIAGVDDNNMPRSVCQYIVSGYTYFDNYENGVYTGTTVYRDGAQTPTQRPDIPAVFELPANFPLMPF